MCQRWRQFALLAMAVSLISFSPAAQASSYLVQIDDLTDNIELNTYLNGSLSAHASFIGEIYDDTYPR